MRKRIINIAHKEADKIEAAIAQVTFLEAPTGIVYSPLFHTLDDPKFATETPTALSLEEFFQVLVELRHCTRRGPTPPAAGAVRHDARVAVRRNEVPVAILDYAFEAVSPAAIKRFLVEIRKTGTLDLTNIDRTKILETRRVMACRPLVETLADGTTVTFNFDTAWHLSNTGSEPLEIVLDADDGRGPRHVSRGSRVRVNYETRGEKRIVVTVRCIDREATTVSTLYIKALGLPVPDETIPIEGVYENVTALGTMKIYLAPGRSGVVRPLFFWTGFDTGATQLDGNALFGFWRATAEDYLADEGINGLLESARQAGYDIVFIEFKDSRTLIQANAALVANGIRLINRRPTKTDPGAILTGSMGGLVARFALLAMEAERPAPEIQKAVFLDSPFLGAIVPMSVQYQLDFYADKFESARKNRDEVLDSPAARQMLRQKYRPWWRDSHDDPQPDEMFSQLQAEYLRLGGWPKETECYAIASGSGAGAGQRQDDGTELKPKDKLLSCENRNELGTWCAEAELFAMPNFPARNDTGATVTFASRTGKLNWPVTAHKTLPWDTCPGGHFDFVRRFKSEAPWTTVDLRASNTCFVPTLSALGIQIIDDPYMKAPPAKDTPFKAIFTSTTNSRHTKLTPEITAWLKKLLCVP